TVLLPFFLKLLGYLVIMAGTVLLAYYFECTDTFQVHIQGFFCQDSNLMKPYPGTEDESQNLLNTTSGSVPILIISMYFIKSTRESLIIQEKTILTGECCYLNPLLRRIIRFIGVFAFGLFATNIFVNAGQVVTGNLAPYFLTVCKPNYTGSDCRAHHQFVNNGNICTGDQDPYAATMYITSTIKTKSSRLAKPVLCLGTLCAAFLTGLNRVSEYRNHCSDVIAGFILGSTVALFLGICVVHNFKGTHGTPSKSKLDEQRGMPLMAFPRVESPLETLSAQVPFNLLFIHFSF
uniref:Phospholipid phosphatase-related protein type 1 n=1 Tax=Naja naja TaxID=35670 RepID=A0A8C7DTE3_NAJNA